MFIVSAHVGSV